MAGHRAGEAHLRNAQLRQAAREVSRLTRSARSIVLLCNSSIFAPGEGCKLIN